MDRKLAERVIATVNHCIGELIETLPIVENGTAAEEYKTYKRSVAKVINTIDVEIVDRVAKNYPDLKPEANL